MSNLVNQWQVLYVMVDNMLLVVVVVVAAVVVVETDNAGLQERSKVTKIRWRLESALSYMLRRSHTDDWTAFAKLTNALTDLRYVADGYDQYTSHLRVMSESGCVNVPALLFDVMSHGPTDRQSE